MGKLNLSMLGSLFGSSDESLMTRVKEEEDPRAFATLVSRWDEPIRRLCSRMVGDMHRGEDLKQETFSRLYSKRAQYQPTGRFSTYLWRIALNICHDDIRRAQRRQDLFPQVDIQDESAEWEEHAGSDPSPDLRVAEAEEGEIVRQALLQLPEIYRTVLVLRHYQQLKLTEIAETLEIPLGTVSSRMAEALGRLSRLLEPHFDKPALPEKPQELLVL